MFHLFAAPVMIAAMSTVQPRVSVIMRSRNSAWCIQEALTGLFSQRFRDFDLLVVDNESTDRTLEMVRRFPCRIIDVPAGDYYPGEILNRAIGETRGDLVVFQNSDCIPLTPHALERLVAAFDDAGVAAAYARQLPRPDAWGWVRRDYARSFPEKPPAPPWMTYSLPFAAMRRAVWRERPFYTQAYASEDTEWGHWARTHGHEVRYIHDALVMHSHNYTPRQAYGRRYIEGEADAFIYGGRDTLVRMAGRIGRAVIRDAVDALRHGRAGELAQLAPLRFVYHWAYYQGHRLGERRIATADPDRSRAQQVVKTRQDDAR